MMGSFKRLTTHFKKWNIWRKHNLNSPLHKLLVLFGLIQSPTLNAYTVMEEAANDFFRGVDDGIKDAEKGKEQFLMDEFFRGVDDTIKSYKKVYFDKYCKSCEYEDRKETDDPCYDCMGEPVRMYSHKPVKWKERL